MVTREEDERAVSREGESERVGDELRCLRLRAAESKGADSFANDDMEVFVVGKDCCRFDGEVVVSGCSSSDSTRNGSTSSSLSACIRR